MYVSASLKITGIISIAAAGYVPGILTILANIVCRLSENTIGKDYVVAAGLLLTVLIYIADGAQSLHHHFSCNSSFLLIVKSIGVGIGRVAVGKCLAVGYSHCAIITCGIDVVCSCGAAQCDSGGADAII